MGKKLCVIGGGRWGQNHIRTLYEMGNLGAIVESNPDTLQVLLKRYPVQTFTNLHDAMKEPFDGFIVATPAETHYAIGKQLLEQGRHVLIEKPLTLASSESEELIRIAEANHARLMVGHLLLFHPAIRKIKELIQDGRIGRLYYLYSTRLNLGIVRTEENVFWSFAPHDISVLEYLVGHPPIKVHAEGAKFLQESIEDVTITQLTYPDNVHAHIFVSWLHPFKEQRLVIIGSKAMISFDDSSSHKNILYYQKRIDWEQELPVKVEEPDGIIAYERSSPLENELKYFMDNLDKTIEIANGKSGLEVVKVLERAQECLR